MPKCNKCGKQAEPRVIANCCTELFCKRCADGLVKSKADCPVCGQVFAPLDDGKELDDVRDYNVTMDCSCPEEDVGCTWTGTMEELDDHLKVCKYSEVECERCEEDVRRMDMTEHLASQCPERDNLQNHLSICQSPSKPQAKEYDDLQKKVDDQQKALEQIKVSTGELKNSQQQQQNQLEEQERRLNDQERASQDQKKKDTTMKERLDKLSSDQGNLRKQQQDQQAKMVEQGKAFTKLERSMNDQQKAAEVTKKQQANQEAKLGDHDTSIAELQAKTASLEKKLRESDDRAKIAIDQLQKQQAEIKKVQKAEQAKVKEQQAKIAEQVDSTSRLEACIEEQMRVDEGLKQSIAKLEKELKKQEEICQKQELDRQSKLTEHQKATTKLENRIQELQVNVQNTLVRLESQQNTFRSQVSRLEEKGKQQAKQTQELLARRPDQSVQDDSGKLEQDLVEQNRQESNLRLVKLKPDHETRSTFPQSTVSEHCVVGYERNAETAPLVGERANEIQQPLQEGLLEDGEERERDNMYMLEVTALIVGGIICAICLMKVNRHI